VATSGKKPRGCENSEIDDHMNSQIDDQIYDSIEMDAGDVDVEPEADNDDTNDIDEDGKYLYPSLPRPFFWVLTISVSSLPPRI
jgi:hypothetical protein